MSSYNSPTACTTPPTGVSLNRARAATLRLLIVAVHRRRAGQRVWIRYRPGLPPIAL